MNAAYILMIVVGLAIGLGGVVQLIRGGRAVREAAAYRERLAGVMLVALGLILVTFAITFTVVTHA